MNAEESSQFQNMLYYYILLQNPNDPTILSSWRQVAFVDDFCDILKDIHCEEKGHIESKKTLEEVHAFDIEFLAVLLYLAICFHRLCKVYEGLPRSAVDQFIQLCIVCHARKPQTTRAPLKAIISSGFMTRGQVCLYRYIVLD